MSSLKHLMCLVVGLNLQVLTYGTPFQPDKSEGESEKNMMTVVNGPEVDDMKEDMAEETPLFMQPMYIIMIALGSIAVGQLIIIIACCIRIKQKRSSKQREDKPQSDRIYKLAPSGEFV